MQMRLPANYILCPPVSVSNSLGPMARKAAQRSMGRIGSAHYGCKERYLTGEAATEGGRAVHLKAVDDSFVSRQRLSA